MPYKNADVVAWLVSAMRDPGLPTDTRVSAASLALLAEHGRIPAPQVAHELSEADEAALIDIGFAYV